MNREVIIQSDYIGNKCFFRAREKQPLGYWETVSPTYIYKKALLNWCKRNGYKVIKNKGQVFKSPEFDIVKFMLDQPARRHW